MSIGVIQLDLTFANICDCRANNQKITLLRSANQLDSPTTKTSAAVSVTRAGFIASGAFGTVLTAFAMLPSFGEYVAHAALNYERGILAPLIASALAPIVMLGISWHLISNSHLIAQRLFSDENPSSTETERAIYRVAFTCIGLLILVSTFPPFIHTIGNTFIENANSNIWPDDLYGQFTLYNLPHIIAFVAQFTLAVYLIVGAPHLVKWQIARAAGNAV